MEYNYPEKSEFEDDSGEIKSINVDLMKFVKYIINEGILQIIEF